jgi:hypothetical protein
MMTKCKCVDLAVIFCAAIVCCDCAQKTVDLRDCKREQAIWTGISGSQVARYTYGVAVGKTPEVLVCEQDEHRDVIEPVPADSYVLTSGNELKIIRLGQSTLPGWYRISRPHDLNWWQRTFSNRPIGEWGALTNQASLPKPSDSDARNAVVIFSAGHWQKVADESKLKDLLDIPNDGVVYVGEPGIGVLQTIDLSRRCP